MNKDSKRAFINILRGLAIFLMLWGHIVQYACAKQFDFFENPVFKFIYSFHMPFFMIISGYLFFFSEQKREMVELIEYKCKSLLYPILMCSVFNFLLSTGIVSVLKGEYGALLGGIRITSLWFLWSVLSCSIALAFAMKLSKNHLIQALLLIIGILIVALFPTWYLNVYMYPYYVIGYLYARNEELFGKVKNVGGIVSTITFVIMYFFYEKKHYIYTSGMLGGDSIAEGIYIDLFRWAIGLFGSIAVTWICYLVYSKIKKGKITSAIEILGQNSLAVYALSTSLLSFWLPQFARIAINTLTWLDWNEHVWLYNLVVTPLITVIYSALFILIIKGLKKCNAYRLIFGR